MTQKAWQQAAVGPCKLTLNSGVEIPKAGKGDVVVANHACGVNPIDWKLTDMPYAAGVQKWPLIPGVDGSGIVTEVGEGVTNVAVGDKVFYLTSIGRGSYAEFSSVPAATTFKLPSNGMSLVEAGTAGCVLSTAAVALFHRLNIGSGGAGGDEFVFVNGGSGGVGSIAVQIAAATPNVKVIATCSSKNVDFVKGLGAHHVIAYDKEDVVVKTKELTGGMGAPKVFDTVGSSTKDLVPLTAHGGSIATILPFPMDQATAGAVFSANIQTHPILVLSYVHPRTYGALISSINRALELVNANKVKIVVSKKFSFAEEVQAALEHNMTGRTVGKVVVVVKE